ncbi:MAG: glycosyltransferase [Thermoflexales bacterium]|nr:glycosyltransferase [Thermoflexales bacterium]
MPKVSVLMSVYNGERYLREAVESILGQTLANFEFIIIDDGSTDDTWNILAEYAFRDRRVVLIRNEGNIGLTHSLNKGLQLARGEYVARLDADDVSLPERLDRQVHYLDLHPHVGVLGTWLSRIDASGNVIDTLALPTVSGVLKWSLHFDNCFPHSSVVLRRALLDQVGAYSSDVAYAQDYELWSRMSTRTLLANLPQVLLLRRLGADNISAIHLQAQSEIVIEVMQATMARTLGDEVPAGFVMNLHRMMRGVTLPDSQSVCELARFIDRLLHAYLASEPLSDTEARWVVRDAASKLYILVGQNVKAYPRAALQVAFQAERLDPRLPSFQTLLSLARDVVY